MPGGDGKGPYGGGGPRIGQELGRAGKGQGRMEGTRPGAGLNGFCVCPICGAMASHQRGNPCYNMGCPKCGTKMVRGQK